MQQASLDAAVSAIASAYYATGAEAAQVQLGFNGVQHKLPMSPGQAAQELQPLLDAARDSGFGKGMGKDSTTEKDPSVRVAKELSAAEFSISGVDLGPILEQVRRALVPEAAGVRAELYKLNIMTAGGFFKPHKDTPPGGPTCFCSLVVCLPVPFAGGDLLLRHGDTEAEVSFANSLLGGIFFYSRSTFPQQMPKDARLHWAAFFGDVEHEVLEVWAGMRLTLTYTLHREAAAQGSSSGSSSTANPLLLRAGQLHDALAAALGDKKFMKDGGTLGYYCRHLYEESSIAQVEGVLGSEGRGAYASKLALKNEDAVVAAVLAAAGLEVQVLRLLQGTDVDNRVLRRMPTEHDTSRIVKLAFVEDESWEDSTTLEEVEKVARHTLEEVAGGKVEWLGNHELATKLWMDVWYSNTGWFGNEASQANFYTGAALIAWVPPASDRGAITAAAQQPLAAQQVGADPAAPGDEARPGSSRQAAGTAAGAGASSSKGPAAGPGSKHSRDGAAGDAEDWQAKRGRLGASSSSAPAAAASGPPTLPYVQPAPGIDVPSGPIAELSSDPGAVAAAAAAGWGVLHITGGKGDTAGDGTATLLIDEEIGLNQVKAFLRQKFGHYKGKRMGVFMLLDGHGQVVRQARARDLKDGARLQMTYI